MEADLEVADIPGQEEACCWRDADPEELHFLLGKGSWKPILLAEHSVRQSVSDPRFQVGFFGTLAAVVHCLLHPFHP